ncbi:MAG: hypothetical protein IKE41_04690, partial [Clostridia bacterium]|nr:hypothetical protein [Clostridia bacterium]
MLHGKDVLKRTFCVVSALVIVSGYCITPIIATSSAEQRRQVKSELQNKRQELAKELRNAKDNVNEEAGKKKNLDAQIEVVQRQIDESNAYIDDLDKEIGDVYITGTPWEVLSYVSSVTGFELAFTESDLTSFPNYNYP